MIRTTVMKEAIEMIPTKGQKADQPSFFLAACKLLDNLMIACAQKRRKCPNETFSPVFRSVNSRLFF